MIKKIGFIGLGNMGIHMAGNLVKAGYNVTGFDKNKDTFIQAKKNHILIGNNIEETVFNSDIIITMLPEGKHVHEVWLELIKYAKANSLIVDCSTIDLDTSIKTHQLAESINALSLDAPVSGGTIGAENGTLTFMVGGNLNNYENMIPLFNIMGSKSIFCGQQGNGQVAKMCNNMILAISMIGAGEIFNLAEKLNLDQKILYDVVSTSTGSCWAINSYCPIENIGPRSPSDNKFKPGFAAKLMLKDVSLAISASKNSNLNLPMGTLAQQIYSKMISSGKGDLDFSAVINTSKN